MSIKESLSETIQTLRQQCKLGCWTELVEEVSAPPDIALALLSGRPELIGMAKIRPLNEDECRQLYHLIRVLLLTNRELQRHAEQMALLVEQFEGHFKGIARLASDIQKYAQFQQPVREDDE